MIEDIFCKIIKKELPADIVLETDDWLAFKDIHPQAPIHILIVAKKHFTDISSVRTEDEKLIGSLSVVVNQLAEKLKLNKGYRLIVNQGEHGGQLVPHLHVHMLGGRNLGPKIVRDDEL